MEIAQKCKLKVKINLEIGRDEIIRINMGIMIRKIDFHFHKFSMDEDFHNNKKRKMPRARLYGKNKLETKGTKMIDRVNINFSLLSSLERRSFFITKKDQSFVLREIWVQNQVPKFALCRNSDYFVRGISRTRRRSRYAMCTSIFIMYCCFIYRATQPTSKGGSAIMQNDFFAGQSSSNALLLLH